ncbi:MAG: hypothetical protein ABI663_06420 [Chryseolinea sp.]
MKNNSDCNDILSPQSGISTPNPATNPNLDFISPWSGSKSSLNWIDANEVPALGMNLICEYSGIPMKLNTIIAVNFFMNFIWSVVYTTTKINQMK